MDEATVLLSKVNSILDKYDEIKRIRGDSFNIFEILNITSNEVQTHSRVIAELLNPKGSHYMGSLFLKRFLDLLDIDIQIDTEDAAIYVEKFIGRISEDRQTGGTIDILLESRGSAIIIENKIFAVDQENQLLRYVNYGRKNYSKRFKVIYLTLDGKTPSKSSTDNQTLDEVVSVSYQDTIVQWISQCRELAIDKPTLRETLTVYRNTLLTLTNQSNDNRMNDEILSIIASSKNNINSFFALRDENLLFGIKAKLIEQLKIDLQRFAFESDLEAEFDENFGLQEAPSYLKFALKSSKKGFYISICFCRWDQNLVLQLNCDNKFRNLIDKDVLSVLPTRSNGFTEIWVKWFEEPYRNWGNNTEPWTGILSGDTQRIIKAKVSEIISFLKDSDLQL